MIDFRGTTGSVLCAYADSKKFVVKLDDQGTNENIAELGNLRHLMGSSRNGTSQSILYILIHIVTFWECKSSRTDGVNHVLVRKNES